MTIYKDIDYILEHLPDNLPYKGAIKRVLIQAPAADVKPIVRGEWIESKKKTIFPNDIIWICSVCGEYYRKHSLYCPHCGAKMEDEE